MWWLYIQAVKIYIKRNSIIELHKVTSPLHVSKRQAVHPQEALLTVYADIGMYNI